MGSEPMQVLIFHAWEGKRSSAAYICRLVPFSGEPTLVEGDPVPMSGWDLPPSKICRILWESVPSSSSSDSDSSYALTVSASGSAEIGLPSKRSHISFQYRKSPFFASLIPTLIRSDRRVGSASAAASKAAFIGFDGGLPLGFPVSPGRHGGLRFSGLGTGFGLPIYQARYSGDFPVIRNRCNQAFRQDLSLTTDATTSLETVRVLAITEYDISPDSCSLFINLAISLFKTFRLVF